MLELLSQSRVRRLSGIGHHSYLAWRARWRGIRIAMDQPCARQVAEQIVSKNEERETIEQTRPENSLDAAIRILKGS
jgi:hypothetical protein